MNIFQYSHQEQQLLWIDGWSTAGTLLNLCGRHFAAVAYRANNVSTLLFNNMVVPFTPDGPLVAFSDPSLFVGLVLFFVTVCVFFFRQLDWEILF